jgi:hypothetical protein
MKLYTYYRSQASFRVRIALNLKGIAREDSFLHLEKGDQFAAAYRAINPQMVVPTIIDGDIKLFQSLAILEYLDEAYPEPPLLPTDPLARAWVRGLALINVADSHPLIVPRVRHYLTDVGGDVIATIGPIINGLTVNPLKDRVNDRKTSLLETHQTLGRQPGRRMSGRWTTRSASRSRRGLPGRVGRRYRGAAPLGRGASPHHLS